MNNDDIEGLDEATRKKIEELQKVTREEDGCRSYASAQMAIEVMLVHRWLSVNT